MFRIIILLTASLILSSCGGGSSSNLNSGSSFNLAITDGPVDTAQEVVVQIDGVFIKPVSGDEIVFNFDTPKVLDLLTLQGNSSEPLLDNVDIPAGDYSWIRLTISAVEDGILDSYIVEDAGTYELHVPSGAQNGLRLVSGFTAVTGGQTDFTIDFDLRKSVTAPPGQTARFLRPVLRLINNQTAGSLSGTVDSGLIASACIDNDLGAVYLYNGVVSTALDIAGTTDDPLATASVNFSSPDYLYEFGFLAPGEYSVAYTCDNKNDDPELVDTLDFYGLDTVTITENTETVLNFPAVP